MIFGRFRLRLEQLCKFVKNNREEGGARRRDRRKTERFEPVGRDHVRHGRAHMRQGRDDVRRGRGHVRERCHHVREYVTMCAKDATMNTKDATMSAKDATMSAKGRNHERITCTKRGATSQELASRTNRSARRCC